MHGSGIGDIEGQRTHCRLGRTVVVEYRATRRRDDAGDERPRARLAAENQKPARQHRATFGAEQRVEVRGRDLQHVDRLHGDVRRVRSRIHRNVGREHVQAAARRQRGEQRGITEVGGNGCDKAHVECFGAEHHPPHEIMRVVRQTAMRHCHTLGRAGRSRGVDDVRDVVGARRAGRVVDGLIGCGRAVERDDLGSAAVVSTTRTAESAI